MMLAMCAAAVLAAVQGRTVSEAYEVGEESQWVIEQAGTEIGYHWSSYLGPVPWQEGEAHLFRGGVKLSVKQPLASVDIRSTCELWTGDQGEPLKCSLRIETTGTCTVVEITLRPEGVGGKVTVGPSEHAVDVPLSGPVWMLANNYVSHLELIARLDPPAEGASRKLEVFSPDALRVVPFELRHQGPFSARPNAGEEGEPVEGVKYRDSLGEVLKMTADGKLHELEVALQSIKFRRTQEPRERFVVLAPAKVARDFDIEQVTIAHGEVSLAGAVTKKRGIDGRLPAIFFVSGSGGQDREGIGGGLDLGTHEILDRLTEEGFLVLRVDDRGVGGSKGNLVNVGYDDLVADARACVDFLLARPDVDPEQVAVIGHSEGGETAPILACERPLAAIVLMATAGRNLMEVLRDQKHNALEEAGFAPPMIEAEMKVHREFLELLCSDQPIDESKVRNDYRPALAQRAWFQGHFRRDVLAQIRQVKCPVWIAQGGKDFQVSATLDAPALLAALEEVQHPDVELRVFPELDHLFKKCPGERSTLQDYALPRPIDPEFLDALVLWLRRRLQP